MIIAHATHHAEKPLPSCGVSLVTLLFPPLIAEAPRGRKVSPLGKDLDGRTKESSEMNGCAASSKKSALERTNIYRPIMIGQGWMSANEIAKAVDRIPDTVRQRMEKLIDSGEVEDQKLSNTTRWFRWVGK